MDFLTNILSGGILGVITSIFSTWFKYKEQKENNKFKLDMIKVQSDASIREIEASVKIQEVITEGAVEANESVGRSSLIQNLTGKYLSDDILRTMINDTSLIGTIFKPLIYLHVLFMDAIRGLIRPILTVGIVWYVTYIINITLDSYLANDFGTENLMTMVIKPTIQLILFSASTVISFWFADKAMARRFQKGSDVFTK